MEANMNIKDFVEHIPAGEKRTCHEEFLEWEISSTLKEEAVLRKYAEEYIQKHMGGEGSFAIICNFIMLEIYKEHYIKTFWGVI